MTDISEELNVTLPTQNDAIELDADVEAHGMREVAVGLGVAAAVLGASGTAQADMTGTAGVGGATTQISDTVHKTLKGTGLKTAKNVSDKLDPATDLLVDAGHGADAAAADGVQKANDEAGAALTAVQEHGVQLLKLAAQAEADIHAAAAEAVLFLGDLQADAEKMKADADEDLKTLAAKAGAAITEVSNTATSLLGKVMDEVKAKLFWADGEKDKAIEIVLSEKAKAEKLAADKLGEVEAEKDKAVTLAGQKLGEVEAEKDKAVTLAGQKLGEVEELGAQKLGEAKTAVKGGVDLGITAVQEVASDAEAARKTTVKAGTDTASSSGHTVQEAAGSTISTVTSAPATVIGAAVDVATQTQEKWEETADDIPAVDIATATEDAAEDVATVVGSAPALDATIGDATKGVSSTASSL